MNDSGRPADLGGSIQANETALGGTGGLIRVEATFSSVVLGAASI